MKLFFLFLSLSLSAQIKGVVKDSISGEPIPYVNIWVENETIVTTSELDGSFSLDLKEEKIVVFSALGFETKKISSNTKVVLLKSVAYEFKEVVVLNKKRTKQIEIGTIKNAIFQSFDNGPKMETKFFPYQKSYSKTKFIKEVTLFTDSRIDKATIKIHFYSVAENGFPGTELLTKDFVVSLKKGILKHTFDVADFDMIFPENGIFVAIEKLFIESNKIGTKYQPYILYNFVERDFFYTYSYGKWHKQEAKLEQKLHINEPSINLILSN